MGISNRIDINPLTPDSAKSDMRVNRLTSLLKITSALFNRLPSLSLKVNSSIPIGAGLGSSAAYCVSLSAALLVSTGVIPCPSAQSSIHGPRAVDFQMPTSTETAESVQLVASDLELICRWGLEGEKLLHGRPSGIDNSISTYGKFLCSIQLWVLT